MPAISYVEGYINLGIALVLLVIKAIAFANALVHSSEAYVAADKLTKPTWCAILGVALGLQLCILVGIDFSIINLALLVAALVYLADVRPALAGLRRR